MPIDDPMTVAMGCIFVWEPEGNPREFAVLTIADRMITLDQIEWEPRQSKTWVVNRRVHVLIAGGYSIHAKAMNKLKEKTYSEDLNVHEFAKLYQKALADQQRADAEATYLQPLGLTVTDLVDGSRLSSAVAESLRKQVQDHPQIDAFAIVAGCDDSQGHIYTATPKALDCNTELGWAVIGSGYYLASTEFIRNRYDKNAPFQTALFTAYHAKKVAESSSGVGRSTDVIQITTKGFNHLNSTVLPTLERAERVYNVSVSNARIHALHEIVLSLQPAEVPLEDPISGKNPSVAFLDRQAD